MTNKDEDFAIFTAFIQKKLRAAAKFVLKCWLFSLIIGLELFLQFGLLLILIGLCLWVLILIILTSPLWIPLSILWAPAAFISYFAFRYTTLGDKVYMVLERVIYHLIYHSTWPRKLVWKYFYNSLSWYLNNETYLTSFNCGYAILTQTGETLKLVAKKDKRQQFQFQMYHYAALGLKNYEDLIGQSILDLGCGRGGGLAFLTKYFQPRLAVGVDISSNQIKFCKSNFNNQKNDFENISFYQGDLECLNQVQELNREKFDIVTCIESAHCIANLGAVLKGVSNILDQDGSFVIADIFDKKDIPALENLFKTAFKIDRKECLTINVKHAMNLDKPRVEKVIESISENSIIQKVLRNFFASAEGSKTYNELGKSSEYLCYVLKKFGAQDESPHRARQERMQMYYRNQNNQSNSSILIDNDPQNQQQSI